MSNVTSRPPKRTRSGKCFNVNVENNEPNLVRINECQVEQSTVGASFHSLESSEVEKLSIKNNHVTEVTENTEITENAGDQITCISKIPTSSTDTDEISNVGCEVKQSTVNVAFNNLKSSEVENLSIENNHAHEVTEKTEITENAGDQLTCISKISTCFLENDKIYNVSQQTNSALNLDSNIASGSRKSSRNRFAAVKSLYNDDLFTLDCNICPVPVRLSNVNLMQHFTLLHKKEVTFDCPLEGCVRSYTVFFTFNRHILQHETELALNRCKLADEVLMNDNLNVICNNTPIFQPEKSAGSNVSEISIIKTNEIVESIETNNFQLVSETSSGTTDCFRTGMITQSSSAVQRKSYIWTRAKFLTQKRENHSCKFEGCSSRAVSVANFDHHVGKYHGNAKNWPCAFCYRVFGSRSVLRKHVRIHRSETENEPPACNFSSNDLSFDKSTPNPILTDEMNIDVSGNFSRFCDGSFGRELLFKSLHCSSNNWKQSFDFMENAHNVASDMIDNFLRALIEIGSMVPNVNDCAIYTNLKSSCENFCFSSESNQYQLLKFLKDQKSFVMSTDLKFGNTCESRNIGGMAVYREIQKSGQFISISQVLKNVIFEHDEILDVCILYSKFLDKLSNDGILFDCMQTEGRFKVNSNVDVLDLPNIEASVFDSNSDKIFDVYLQLYFDEVEPVNPIGTRTTIHKLGCFYWTLSNLPPWISSDMRMMHVVAFVAYLDIVEFGFSEVLNTISEDLKQLEKGMKILTRSGKEFILFGKGMTFVADNLAYNAVMGFNESFSAGSCCSKCVIPQSMFKDRHEECFDELRTPSRCIENFELKCNGVRRVCELKTNFFNPYENFTGDLHHDIFQGGLMHTLRVVLNDLIPDYLTINDLNYRINHFGYGRDIDGKPSEISYDRVKDKSAGHFKQKYDQMFTLFRFLPLIIGDFIPVMDDTWLFLLDYLYLIFFLMSPAFLESDYQVLGA